MASLPCGFCPLEGVERQSIHWGGEPCFGGMDELPLWELQATKPHPPRFPALQQDRVDTGRDALPACGPGREVSPGTAPLFLPPTQ